MNAPTSALSARFVLHRLSGGSDVTVNINRGSNLAANTATVTFGTQVTSGNDYTLTGTFYANPSQGAPTVGTMSASVGVATDGSITKPDGSALGSVNFTGTIKAVTIPAGQKVDLNKTTNLVASALDSLNNPVVVGAGSFTFAVTSGGSNISVTPNGVATGLALGAATLTATVDGVTSAAQSVTCMAADLSTLSMNVTDLAFDSVSGKLFACVANTGPHAGEIVVIDPIDGSIFDTIPLGLNLDEIVVTDDGQFAYVAVHADNSVRRVNLASKTVDQVLTSVPSVTLSTIPGQPHAICIGADPTGGVNVSVYDDTTRRTGTGAGGGYILATSSTTLYGRGGSSFFTCTLDPTSITWTNQTDGVVDGNFDYYNGKIYTDTGRIVDPITRTLLNQFPATHFLIDHVCAASGPENRVYFVTWDNAISKKIVTFNMTTLAELTLRDTGVTQGGAESIVACGNHMVAFRTFNSGTTEKICIVRNLP